jgi:glycosyltransferase involved in cell wall biosynthesis
VKTTPTVVFFARARRDLVGLLEFYTEDIASLRALGFEVRIETQAWRAAFAPGAFCYAWWWHTATAVVLAWRLRRRPVVVTGALGDSSYSVSRRVLTRLTARVSARLATTNIAISDAQLGMPHLVGTRASRIYCAVDTAYFVPGAKSDWPLGIIVAQVNPPSIARKGIDVAIAATAYIRLAFPNYRLAVVGPVTKAGERSLEELRRRLDFSGVDIYGEVDRERKRQLLSSAWVCLQPSTFEGFGLSVAEAMACATPAVCTRRGSLPEIVGNTGVLLDSRDPSAVAGAVVDLLRNDSLRSELGRAARVRAVAEFAEERRVAELAALLKEAGVLSRI